MPPSIKVKNVHPKCPVTSLRIEHLLNERIQEIQILSVAIKRSKSSVNCPIDLSININTPQYDEALDTSLANKILSDLALTSTWDS